MAKTKTSWGRKDFKTVNSSQKQEATSVPISGPEFSRKRGLKSLVGGSAAGWARPRAWGLCGEVLPPKGEQLSHPDMPAQGSPVTHAAWGLVP